MATNRERFQEAMNQGHSAAWDQRWDLAAGFYRQALDEFPDDPSALANLGLALYEQQEFENALQCYTRAASLSDTDPIPVEKIAQLHERLGNLKQASQSALNAAERYIKNKDVNKAIENWSRVTRLDPENLRAHSHLAMVYEKLGEKQKAVTEYLALASLLQHAGDLQKAVQSATHALSIIPDSKEVVRALQMLQRNKLLPKPARARGGTAPLRMSQVRQMDAPAEPEQSENKLDPVAHARQRALTLLAEMLFEGNEDAEARHGMQAIVRGTGTLPRVYDRGRIVLHLSQVVDQQTHEKYAQAAQELERAMEAGLDHPAGSYDLGYLYAQIGKQESALRNLQQAASFPDFSLGAHLLMGSILRKQGRLMESSTEYLEALKIADAAIVPQDRADDLRQLYDPIIETHRKQAEQQVQERVCENVHDLLMRSDWRAHLVTARKQLPSHDGGESPPLPLAELLTEASSSHLVERISRIYHLAREGNHASAMEEAFYALQEAPTYLPLHTYIGELLLKEDHLQEAVAKFIVVARAYATRGEPQRAVDTYHRIIQLAPMDLSARSKLIELLISQGRDEEAILVYMDLAEVYYSLADLEMSRKSYREALRLAHQAQIEQSLRVQLLHRMADIDLQSLNWRQALRIFEQIRILQPDDEKARTNLVELNYRLGKEPQALGELDGYISFLIQRDQRDKAASFMKQILEENPDRTHIRMRLSQLLRQMGRKDQIT